MGPGVKPHLWLKGAQGALVGGDGNQQAWTASSPSPTSLHLLGARNQTTAPVQWTVPLRG